MNSHSAPREQGSWWDWLFRRNVPHQDTGWQREREQPERNTDGMPPIQYPLHQHEQPVLPIGATLANHPHWRKWLDEQPVLEPRLVEETGPKSRERAGHEQKIRPKLAGPSSYPPQWPVQDTDGIRRIQDKPAGLDFLHAELPHAAQGALPVRRMASAGHLATMRPYGERRYELPRTPIDELPTAQDSDAIVEAHLRGLPPWRVPDQPIAVPDDWLNSPVQPAAVEDIWPPVVALVEVWTEQDQPAEEFDPDRTIKKIEIHGNPLGVTEQDCAPDLGNEEEGTAQASALLRLRFCEHKKEEGKL